MHNSDKSTQDNQSSTRIIGAKNLIKLFEQKISDNIKKYYPVLDIKKTSITGKPLGGQFAKTFKFDISSDDNNYCIYVKICPVFEKLNASEKEYDTLTILYDKMASSKNNYFVSRPIEYYPELNAYALESVGTNDFRSYILKNNSILKSKTKIDELVNKIEGCAGWLNNFHKITESEKCVKFNGKDYYDGFMEEFDYKELRKFSFQNNTLDMLDNTMEKIFNFASDLNMQCAKWHWDYTPGHVYFDNGKISVIDILGVDDTPIYEDIGHFLAALTSINNLPFHPLFNYDRACTSLCDKFIDAYHLNSKISHDDFLLLASIYRLKYLIIYFLGQYRLISLKSRPFIGRFIANYRIVKIFDKPLVHTMKTINMLLAQKNNN